MRTAAYYDIILIFKCPGDRLVEMAKIPIIQAQKLITVYSSGKIQVTAIKIRDLVVALWHE